MNKKKKPDNSEEVKKGFQGENLSHSEISEEQRQERLFLTGLILEKTDGLIKAHKARKKKKDEEIIELYSGRRITHKAYVSSKRRPYFAEFPNDNGFFFQIFRINFPHLDYKKYRKPPVVGEILKQIVYGRFPLEVYHILDVLNPILPGGTRKYKLFQNLNNDGLTLLRQFRDEAEQLMKEFEYGQWYAFRKELLRKYKVPMQLNIFEEND